MFYGELMRHDHEQKQVLVLGKAEYGNCFSREDSMKETFKRRQI